MNAAVGSFLFRSAPLDSFADPVPSGEEILVTVAAAGLHPIVKLLAAGKHYSSTSELPFVPGLDGVGHLPDGSRVYFARSRPQYGTFAERSLTQRAACIPIPEAQRCNGRCDYESRDVVVGALTERTRLAPGESILILGATGVGAGWRSGRRRLGARRVVAAGRNPQALEKMSALGADLVISLAQEHGALVGAFRDALVQGKDGPDSRLRVWGAPADALLEAITQRGASHSSERIRFVPGWLQRGTDGCCSTRLRACGARRWN